MKIFKKIIGILNLSISNFGFVVGIAGLFDGEYELASWVLFCVSILFMVGYFAERWSK